MSANQVSKNFVVQEFINPEAYAKDGDKSISLIDPKLIIIAQWVRDDIGKSITINNWHSGGIFKESGLRDKNTGTGAKGSQHKLGKAIDPKIAGMTGKMWYDYVKSNVVELYALGLRRIEHYSLATTWCHMDTKEHGKKCIQVVDLTKIVEEIKI